MTKLIVIAGATGVGKSGIAYDIAKEFKLNIINADASQMQYWMSIGTANINEYDDDVVFELYNYFEPQTPFSIKDYQDLARRRVGEHDACVICGGSGLYIDALCLDLDLSSSKRNSDFTALSNEEVYEKLKAINSSLAEKSHVNNRKRNERYLEIALEDSLPKKDPKELYDILYINIERNRAELYERINSRCLSMFDEGWIDEAKDLKKKGYDLSTFKEIGYKEIGMYIDDSISKEEMIELIQKNTRHYAKRQMTWFRGAKKKYKNYYTFDPSKDKELIINTVKEFLN